MFGRFIFLLLILCILVTFIDGHHRRNRKTKCSECDCTDEQDYDDENDCDDNHDCDEEKYSSTVQSMPPNSPSSVASRLTKKTTIPPTTKTTAPPPTTKTTAPPPTTKTTAPPPTTKTTAPPTTKSTITISKFTTKIPAQCDSCASIPVNCSTNVGKNQAGNIVFSAKTIMYPTSTDEIVYLVQNCAGQINCIGHGHSFNGIANAKDVIISLAKMRKIIYYNRAIPSVRVQGGTWYSDIYKDLAANGYAFLMTAGLGSIAIAGAASTDTHGGGLAHKVLADQIIAMTVVLANGTVLNLDRNKDTRLLPALLVSLGCTYIIAEVEIKLEPLYKCERVGFQGMSLANFAQNYHQILADGYSVQLHWVASNPNELQQINLINRLGDPKYQDFTGYTNYYGATVRKIEKADYCYVYEFHYLPVVPAGTPIRAGSAYFVDVDAAPAALQALASSPFVAELATVSNRFELRTVAADDIWMSPMNSNGKPKFCFDIIWELHVNYYPTLIKVEQLLQKFNCTSHWGKLFDMTPDKYSSQFPNWDNFIKLVRELDPAKKLTNPWLDLKLFQGK